MPGQNGSQLHYFNSLSMNQGLKVLYAPINSLYKLDVCQSTLFAIHWRRFTIARLWVCWLSYKWQLFHHGFQWQDYKLVQIVDIGVVKLPAWRKHNIVYLATSQALFISQEHFPDTALPAAYPATLECAASSWHVYVLTARFVKRSKV